MGYQIGKKFKKYLSTVISKYECKLPQAIDSVKHLEMKLKALLPNCLDEIYGRADGAEVSRDAMLLLFFPEIFKRIDGCTTAIVKKSDKVLFVHNEDEKNCRRKIKFKKS